MSNAQQSEQSSSQTRLTITSHRVKRHLIAVAGVLAVALVSVSTVPVEAAIRILGPQDEMAAETASPQPTPAVASAQQYGPTGANETLWSIATQMRPNTQVSVYQTLGAIFRLNTDAFTNNNIHSLQPGSTLVMPTLAQIERESTQDVVNRLEIDEARKQAQNTTPLSEQVEQPSPQPSPAPSTNTQPEQSQPEQTSQDTSQSSEETQQASAPEPQVVQNLQSQLQASDQEMTRLVESNHVLKVRLSEVQHELSALKEQMSGDAEINKEIRAFLEKQRQQQVAEDTQPPSVVESLLDSPLLLAMLAIIPGALITGAIFFFLARRRKQEEDAEEPAALDHDDIDDMPVVMVPDPDEDDVDDPQDDDELEITDDETASEDIAFGDDTDLDDLDLDDELDDMAGNESSVAPTSDDAIGLEDMERALDELADTPPADKDSAADDTSSDEGDESETGDTDQPEEEMSADEALAAEWAKALEEGNDSDVDDIDALLAGEADGNAAEAPAEEPESESAETKAQTSEEREDNDEQAPNDALFDSVLDDEPELDLSQDIDLSDDDNDDNVSLDNTTELLDELVGDEEDEDSWLNEGDDTEGEFDESSDALLDEVLDKDDDPHLEDSDALLEEVLGDDDEPDPLADDDDPALWGEEDDSDPNEAELEQLLYASDTQTEETPDTDPGSETGAEQDSDADAPADTPAAAESSEADEEPAADDDAEDEPQAA
ncbi:FimV/HubP family polar landmark protein, partial [Salinivibrio sp. HTSP]|uniref:FimV/HubP family polar landmark protein n=1 Tax=Salinivibrio sp. HTSP TaxID=2115977 RepID=UPI0023DE1420